MKKLLLPVSVGTRKASRQKEIWWANSFIQSHLPLSTLFGKFRNSVLVLDIF